MNQQVGIDFRLNVGNAVSDAKTLESSIMAIGKAMESATAAGDADSAKNYGMLQLAMRKQMLTEMKHASVGGSGDNDDNESRVLRTVNGISKIIGKSQGYIGAAGSGNVAGAALGAANDGAGLLQTLGGLPSGVLVGGAVVGAVVGLGMAANKLSEQWEKVMQPSMALAASMGRLGADADKNSLAFREVYDRATKSTILHGYTNEEGIALANQMSKLGVAGEDVYAAEEQVFRYQRDTDADRNTLSKAAGLSRLYAGGEDVLAYAYGGIQASGMQSGQYQEYLNATLKIFEDGLSRGVVKGFSEITRTQNMLAQIGTTWKGELGAERYQQMDDSVTGAGKLNNDMNVVMYRAMQSVMEKDRSGAYTKDGKVVHNYSGDSRNDVDVTKNLEKGLTPELLKEAIGTLENIGNGDENYVSRAIMEMFGTTMTSSEELYKAYKAGDFDKAFDVAKTPESQGAVSTEIKMLDSVHEIQKNIALLGSDFLPAKTVIIDKLSQITNLIGGSKAFGYYANQVGRDFGSITNPDNGYETNRMTELMKKAWKNTDSQPDTNGDTLGDYAVNATKVDDLIKNLPVDMQYKLATNPALAKTLFGPFQKVNDFTDSKVAEFERTLKDTPSYPHASKEYMERLELGPAFEEAYNNGDPWAVAIVDRIKSQTGNRVTNFNKSSEGTYLKSAVSGAEKDGLSSEELKNIAYGVVSESARSVQSIRDAVNADQQKDFAQNVAFDIAPDPDTQADEQIKTILMTRASDIPVDKLRELISGVKDKKSDEGMLISSKELEGLVVALNALLPALKENSSVRVVTE